MKLLKLLLIFNSKIYNKSIKYKFSIKKFYRSLNLLTIFSLKQPFICNATSLNEYQSIYNVTDNEYNQKLQNISFLFVLIWNKIEHKVSIVFV